MSVWSRFKRWLGWGEQPPQEYDANRAPGDDKARRNMFPNLTDAEYEDMSRRNGWR